MLQIINYSEKAVAVIGDTKEIKEQLKSMGGRFNPRLSCGTGMLSNMHRAFIVVHTASIQPAVSKAVGSLLQIIPMAKKF